jgi:hypothetical protein
MMVLQKWIDIQKLKMKVLLKSNLEICIEWSQPKKITISPTKL